jgi:hypothetical protein
MTSYVSGQVKLGHYPASHKKRVAQISFVSCVEIELIASL